MAWYTEFTYTPTGGPVPAAPKPGSIGYGWQDASGSSWSIDGSNRLNQIIGSALYSNGHLLRPVSDNPADGAAQIVVHFVAQSRGGVYAVFRMQNYGTSSATALYAGFLNGSTHNYVNLTNGVNTTNIAGPATGMTIGTAYYAVMNCVQTSATQTTLSVSIYTDDGNNTLVSSSTHVNSVSSFQNVTGQTGIAENIAGTPISSVSYAVDTSFTLVTGYIVSLPSSAGLNATQTGTVALVGGTVLGAPLVVTLTDANGAFVGDPITFNPGTPTSPASFSWTPQTVGSHTITASHAGGNTGTIDPTALSISVTNPPATSYTIAAPGSVSV